jgi:DNA repair exonuclease SbcCD ATPase subunit
MLSGTQLATAITAVLIAAVALGWTLHWLWVRLSNAAISDTARITEMINRLHEADRAREAAVDAKELAENLLASREAEMENRMAAMQARLDGAVEGREAELARELRETKAESEASMSGLRNARERIMDLEREVEELRRLAG